MALQLTPTPTEWLSCSTDNIQGCLTSSCPGLYIEEDDWTNCQTESLGIFRALGTGQIRVGDLIALHHSQKPGTWLSCNSTDCKLSSSCLGLPSLQNGFHIGVQWPDCLEQVFRIHARNKNTGQIVECGDSVSLQPFLSTNGRLNHEGGRIHIDECSSESTGDRYEECNRETFTVWTKQ